jgi:hypothetical protein
MHLDLSDDKAAALAQELADALGLTRGRNTRAVAEPLALECRPGVISQYG